MLKNILPQQTSNTKLLRQNSVACLPCTNVQNANLESNISNINSVFPKTEKQSWFGEKLRKIGCDEIADWWEDKDKICTDGKDDGELSWSEKLKSFSKGLGSLIKDACNHPLATGIIVGAGVLTTVLTGGAALPVIAGLGAVVGAGTICYGGYKASQAKTDAQAKQAWETIGSGTFATATSALSAISALNAAKLAGVADISTEGLNAISATTKCIKITPKAIVQSGKNIKEMFNKKVDIPKIKLFDGAIKKPALKLDDIKPESLVLVRRTDYFPTDGKILSASKAIKNADGTSEYRPTIHFSLNRAVVEHEFGNPWNDMEYSIILPFKETIEQMPKSKVIGGIQDDFFFLDEVKLPKGSVILKHNQEIPRGELKISEAFDGVKLVETSEDMTTATDLVIEKMGYSTYNKTLQEYLNVTDEEMALIKKDAGFFEKCEMGTANIDKAIKQTEDGIKILQEGTVDDFLSGLIENNKLALRYLNLMKKCAPKVNNNTKSWQTFCNGQSYFNEKHMKSPWAKSELTFCLINILTKAKSSWLVENENIQSILLKKLPVIKSQIPKDKSLGYDIDKLISIIKTSETPELAQIRISQELKIKPLHVDDKTAVLKRQGLTDDQIQSLKNDINEDLTLGLAFILDQLELEL